MSEICCVCRRPMDRRPNAKYHEDCYNAYRRLRYKKDPAYREQQIRRVLHYETTPQGQRMRRVAEAKRKKEGRLVWYRAPTHTIPPELLALLRVYRNVVRRLRLGQIPAKHIKHARSVVRFMKQMRSKPSRAKAREFLRGIPEEL